MAEYLTKEYGDLNEMASDNNDDNNDETNSKDVEVVETSSGETLKMLYRLVNLR